MRNGDLCVAKTRPYETWGFKTTFLSLREKTLIRAFCVGELGIIWLSVEGEKLVISPFEQEIW